MGYAVGGGAMQWGEGVMQWGEGFMQWGVGAMQWGGGGYAVGGGGGQWGWAVGVGGWGLCSEGGLGLGGQVTYIVCTVKLTGSSYYQCRYRAQIKRKYV